MPPLARGAEALGAFALLTALRPAPMRAFFGHGGVQDGGAGVEA